MLFDTIREGMDYKRLAGGKWLEGKEYQEIFSPTDGSLCGRIPLMGEMDIHAAVEACATAQKQWRNVPLAERGNVLLRCADLLEEYQEELTDMLVREIAKEVASSRAEVMRTADLIRATVHFAKTMTGEALQGGAMGGDTAGKTAIVSRVPLGVILAVSPFNYPINLAMSKIAPALVMGNAVAFKPPTQGSVVSLCMAKCLQAAGLPDGLLCTITGSGRLVGQYLMKEPSIRMINFTGSTQVGQIIAQEVGMIPLVMELGGKDAAVILADADLDHAVGQIISGAFGYSGQRCTAIKRVLVLEEIADTFVCKLKKEMKKITVGSPYDGCMVTPLIHEEAADFVMELVEDAKSRGADIFETGQRKGNLLYPICADHVTEEMRLAWEEPFGPVLPVLRVKTAEEAVRIANKSEYGLQASVFGNNIKEVFAVVDRLEAGTVNINGKSERSPDHFPFLGTKLSGIGVQGIRYALEASSTVKSVVLNRI